MRQYKLSGFLCCFYTGRIITVKVLLLVTLLCGSFTHTAASQVIKDSVTISATPAVQENNGRKFKPDFKDKYTGSDFNYKRAVVAKSRWERIKEWFFNWLGELFTSDDPKKSGNIYKIIFSAIAVLVILFVVYMIVASIINKEGLWIFGRARKKISAGDIAAEDINQMDFKVLIENTRKNNDYRLAVRYYYLWLLKKLSVKNIIDWNWEKTNSDYLYEIKDSSLKKDFEYLSYVYDYSWYGEFTLTDESFNKAEKAFLKTFKNL